MAESEPLAHRAPMSVSKSPIHVNSATAAGMPIASAANTANGVAPRSQSARFFEGSYAVPATNSSLAAAAAAAASQSRVHHFHNPHTNQFFRVKPPQKHNTRSRSIVPVSSAMARANAGAGSAMQNGAGGGGAAPLSPSLQNAVRASPATSAAATNDDVLQPLNWLHSPDLMRAGVQLMQPPTPPLSPPGGGGGANGSEEENDDERDVGAASPLPTLDPMAIGAVPAFAFDDAIDETPARARAAQWPQASPPPPHSSSTSRQLYNHRAVRSPLCLVQLTRPEPPAGLPIVLRSIRTAHRQPAVPLAQYFSTVLYAVNRPAGPWSSVLFRSVVLCAERSNECRCRCQCQRGRNAFHFISLHFNSCHLI